jgi:UDP-N-acetylglucosamine 2-epimerase
MEGRYAAKAIDSEIKFPLKYDNMSTIMFFNPEIASIGLNEKECQKEKIAYKVVFYKHSLFIIGNSSSGIIESASAKIPAINVGIRQMGRKANNNVIFCQSDYQNISQSITQALNFKEKIYNIYGDGNSANKAYKLIKKLDFKKYLIKDEDILDEK